MAYRKQALSVRSGMPSAHGDEFLQLPLWYQICRHKVTAAQLVTTKSRSVAWEPLNFVLYEWKLSTCGLTYCSLEHRVACRKASLNEYNGIQSGSAGRGWWPSSQTETSSGKWWFSKLNPVEALPPSVFVIVHRWSMLHIGSFKGRFEGSYTSWSVILQAREDGRCTLSSGNSWFCVCMNVCMCVPACVHVCNCVIFSKHCWTFSLPISF